VTTSECTRCGGSILPPGALPAAGDLVGVCACPDPRSNASAPLVVPVDPGWSCCAFAAYVDGQLALARLVRAPAHEGPRALDPALRELGLVEVREFRGVPQHRYPRGVVLVEWPRIYPSGVSEKKGTRNPNDVLKVAQSAGAWLGAGVGLGMAARQVEPRAWKGNLDKKKVERRLREALSAAELRVLDAALAPLQKDLRHNVVDAAAIGAWVLGRVPLAPRDPRLLEP
jgi:hypothetical protein